MVSDHFSPAWTVFALLVAAVAAVPLARRFGKFSSVLLALVPASLFAYFLAATPAVWAGQTWRGVFEWAPMLGIDWQLWLSPLGLLLGLLVTGVGTLVVCYSGGYLGDSPKLGRFLAILMVFTAAMLGMAVTENLIVFFLWWELTSVASYLLIGFYHDKEESRKAALDALLVTAGGGIALLAGILLLGEVGGSYQLGELIANRDAVVGSPLYPAIFCCVLIGAITKSAQFPFHFWLPGAMAAPAPVSAFLHSATMVKAGVFLLALMHPLLGGTPLWHFTLLGLGAVTMTWGALVAVVQTDLKRLLAFTTVSALGTLVMLLGIEHELAAKGAVVFLIVHALYKGSLFMVAGILEKATGTRDVKQFRGLMHSMPVLGVAAVAAACSMSGIPPFVGFIAKELLYEVKLEAPLVGWGLLICGFVANAANIVVALKVGVAPFISRGASKLTLEKPPGLLLLAGPVLLGVGSLVAGVFPGTVLGPGVEAMVAQINAEPADVYLKLWHGFNLVLLLSALTLAAGLAGFFFRHRFWQAGEWLANRVGWRGQAVFRAGLAKFLAFAERVTVALQSGNLRSYLGIILMTALGLLLAAFVLSGYRPSMPSFSRFRPDVLVAVLLIALCATLVLGAKRRMTHILLLGCVGFGIAAFFALYGAPDLAVTQLLVETLMLLLFALAIHGLPGLEVSDVIRRRRFLPALIALTTGVVFTLLTLKAFDVGVDEPVSVEIASRSLPEGYGRNVVNVILVDFRALDTLGEVAVLVIAALGVAAMLQSNCAKANRLAPRVSLPPRSAVLLASARYTSPAMVAFAIFLLLRGHNEPGGGFIGGLLAAMAAVFSHLAHPSRELRLFGLRAETLAVLGLLLAVVSGLPGLFAKGSFLAASWGGQVTLPLLGKIKFGTPLLFDIGVFLAVVGITLLLYRTIELWQRSRRGGGGGTVAAVGELD